MSQVANSRVSVIIPVYKGDRYIVQAIESVLAQTYRDFEILVVNDGSPDNTSTIIKPYVALPNVKYIEQDNRGVAAARNTGIRNASGQIIAFLDHDDLWLPDKLALQAAHLASHAEDQLVHGYQLYADADGHGVQYSKDWVANVSGHCFAVLFQRNRIATSTVAVRRTCLDEVGLLDETISKSDDYELWLRIARRFRIGFIAKPLAIYRLHDANASRDSFAMERTELGAIEAIVKQFPDTYRRIGAERVHARLFELNFHVGNWYMWQAQDHRTARGYFKAALKHRPLHLASLGRFAWCSLTKPQRQACAWYFERARVMLGGSSK